MLARQRQGSRGLHSGQSWAVARSLAESRRRGLMGTAPPTRARARGSTGHCLRGLDAPAPIPGQVGRGETGQGRRSLAFLPWTSRAQAPQLFFATCASDGHEGSAPGATPSYPAEGPPWAPRPGEPSVGKSCIQAGAPFSPSSSSFDLGRSGSLAWSTKCRACSSSCAPSRSSRVGPAAAWSLAAACSPRRPWALRWFFEWAEACEPSLGGFPLLPCLSCHCPALAPLVALLVCVSSISLAARATVTTIPRSRVIRRAGLGPMPPPVTCDPERPSSLGVAPPAHGLVRGRPPRVCTTLAPECGLGGSRRSRRPSAHSHGQSCGCGGDCRCGWPSGGCPPLGLAFPVEVDLHGSGPPLSGGMGTGCLSCGEASTSPGGGCGFGVRSCLARGLSGRCVFGHALGDHLFGDRWTASAFAGHVPGRGAPAGVPPCRCAGAVGPAPVQEAVRRRAGLSSLRSGLYSPGPAARFLGRSRYTKSHPGAAPPAAVGLPPGRDPACPWALLLGARLAAPGRSSVPPAPALALGTLWPAPTWGLVGALGAPQWRAQAFGAAGPGRPSAALPAAA